MSIDTERKRRSVPPMGVMPSPDGSIDASDRAQAMGLYYPFVTPPAAGTYRNVVIGIDPYNGPNATYSWDVVDDGNTEAKMMTCAFVPSPAKYGILGTRQECLFLGVLGNNVLVKTFDSTKSQDDTSVIVANAITNRIDPELANGGMPDAKEYLSVDFQNINPFSKGLDIDYAVESEDPIEDIVTWNNLYWETGSSTAYFPDCVGQWVHLKITDETNITNRPVFGSFIARYCSLFDRGQEET